MKKHWGVRLLVAAVLLALACVGWKSAWRLYHQIGYPRRYEQQVSAASAEFGVPESLIYAIMKTESDFRPEAVSSDDACGLMQMLPDTLSWLQKLLPGERAYIREDLFKPEISIRYGVFYLSWLQKRFFTDKTVAAAYHAGFGAVGKWLKNEQYSTDGVALMQIPYADTAWYVEKVLYSKQVYQNLYEKGRP